MKKILLFLCAVVTFAAFASVGFAESRLEEYDRLLTGSWGRLSGGTVNVDKYQDFDRVLIFEYPSVNEEKTLVEKYDSIPYSTYLTEGADGKIYLALISGSVSVIGEVALSSDGTTLFVFPSFSDGYVVFVKNYSPEIGPG